MKKLLILALLTAAAYTATAQTNVSYRITVDGVNTSWSYDAAGTKKDVTRLDGLKYAYNVYTASLDTNAVPLAFGPWLKRQHVVLVDNYAEQKQRADTAALLAKLTALLTANTDLLTASDMTKLSDVAAKLP